jgi:hypothetical protein
LQYITIDSLQFLSPPTTSGGVWGT